jgi:tetratricopeptide (TPR) repeat protein
MQIVLRSRPAKFSFAAACLIGAAFYTNLVLRAFLAAHFAAKLDLPRLERAIRLEPENADYYDVLGRNLALSGSSLDEALSNYRKATYLNPYDARYWLDLAGAYQLLGRIHEQGESVERAVHADPTTPHVAWEAANFFLVQGDRERALRYFRVVLANDPEAVDSTLQICWRASGNASEMLDLALPASADIYLSFLRLLVANNDVASAENVWNRLIGLGQTFSAKSALSFFGLLIAKKEVEVAKTAWQQLSIADHSLQSYLPSSENLVVNGGFEENMLNGGFDWWYQPHPQATLAIDTSEFHSGTRALSVTFGGHSVPGAPVFQFIAAKPSTSYEFSAQLRTEDIDTASGPRFAIVDAYTNYSYVLTEDTLGTTPWRLHEALFQTGPTTNLLVLKIVRDPAAPLIRGKLWIDDVKLIEKRN